MTDLPKHKMAADEFLDWVESLLPEAGRFELWDGEVVVRDGPGGFKERSQHWKMKLAIALALHAAIERSGLPCFLAVDGPVVQLSPNEMARPDALVYLGPDVPADVQEVPNPLILVEVLSPSTSKRDHGVKLQGYFTLPSLHHYLIIDPDRRLLIHHKRRAGASPETVIVTGADLRLDPPGLDVNLAKVLAS